MAAVIYPASIKTDKDKLFACYSLVEQMRLEYNRVAEIARSDPDKYLETGKFRTYAQMAKGFLKQLLAERNRLMEAIRWANYTPKQWESLSDKSLEEQHAVFVALFGDREQEKVKPTEATSPLLDELEAIALDMPSKLSADPTEDFTTYTEADEGNDISKTADRITSTNCQPRADTFYVYKDKGVNHFDGNFEHRVKFYVSLFSVGTYNGFWVVANNIADMAALIVASLSNLCSFYYYDGVGYYLYLREVDGSNVYQDSYIGLSTSTIYYCTIERDEGIGTYGTLYLYLCTGNYYGEAGSSLVDTLSVALHTSKKDFRYIYGCSSYDDSWGSAATSGYVELLNLQEAGGLTKSFGIIMG